MRTITISTDTYAAIWARREPGEETEDAVLQRLLGVRRASAPPPSAPASRGDGFNDERNGVHFAEGFEIFRIYKGRKFTARATAGKWLLTNNNQFYSSLHKLSSAVVEGNENSWHNWKYRLPDGREAFIHSLRDDSKVISRSA